MGGSVSLCATPSSRELDRMRQARQANVFTCLEDAGVGRQSCLVFFKKEGVEFGEGSGGRWWDVSRYRQRNMLDWKLTPPPHSRCERVLPAEGLEEVCR